ncbi:hypothetical protein [Terrihabitans rhizophilus]|jgi:hypothetical protein|uniref:Uncharacterized protein n=1 Tax=Terrihabitans rhizophilus TaxID=3092662 RepID=A0ABU4RMP2_9HYPH|nr:hypothetical protein [Terrihabitans sp. PJ23]MDX6806090.1 hypothetical protein [Terrihabitans sp. PJ23]
MIKIFTSAALAAAIAVGSFVVPASAQGVSISVGERARDYDRRDYRDYDRRDYRGERHVERRVIREERRPVRVVREQRCRTKTVITRRGGERIVRKIRTCR